MGSDVMSGMGCGRDQALKDAGRGMWHNNTKNYNTGVASEQELLPLELLEFGQLDFVRGNLVSKKGGKIVPLDLALPFAGIIEQIGEDRGTYVAAVLTRGAVHVTVNGLNRGTPEGAKVYARPAGRTQVFSLEAQDVLIGEICAIEDLERGIAIVGFRTPGDSRPFELSGPRATRS